MRPSSLCALVLAALVALPVFAGCSDDSAASPVAVDDDVPDHALKTTLSVPVLRSARTYEAFATEGGGFGQAGHLMKYFVDIRAGGAATYFVNSNFIEGGRVPDYATYHFDFAKHALAFPDDGELFNEHTYYGDEKWFISGSIQTYTLGGEKVYAIQFYPDDVIHEQGILRAIEILRPRITIPGAHVVFVATGPQQTVAEVAPAIRALGVEPMTIDQILGSLTYLPLNPGEAWGTLRIFPGAQGELRPTDIPVFDELPLDLSVVAGTITRSYQDVTSHVNLKSKERGTPNMVLRDASLDHEKLAPFADKPVHLSVTKTGFSIEPSTAEEVEDKFRQRTDRPWIVLPQVNRKDLVDYDDMCAAFGATCVEDGGNFGGKATNLGFLAHSTVLGRYSQSTSLSHKYGYDLAPYGFGVPVARYREFVAANPALAEALSALIAKEKAGNLSPNERAALALDVRKLFYAAQIPDASRVEIEAKIAALADRFVGLRELKIRSSSNAEDIPSFDGAGLHDSFSVKLGDQDRPDRSCAIVEKTEGGVVTKLDIEPETVQCAVKAVYASLWNARAIEERSFARLDHATSGMGLAVVPAYDTEANVVANGVVITRIINGADINGYTLTMQVGNNLVTNPDPGTIAQLSVVTFSADFSRPDRYTVVRYATPTRGEPAATRPVLSDAMMGEIVAVAKRAEDRYCAATPRYNGGSCVYIHMNSKKPASLDMEWKLLADRRIVLKQVREFHGR